MKHSNYGRTDQAPRDRVSQAGNLPACFGIKGDPVDKGPESMESQFRTKPNPFAAD